VFGILAVIVLAVAVALLLAAQSRKRRAAEWRARAGGVLDAAVAARALLPASGAELRDPAAWQAARSQVEQSAVALELAASGAPPAEAAASTRAAAGLRNLSSALETDRLLRDGSRPVTPDQLAAADAALRAQSAEVDAALASLETLVHPPAG
jgi:hypothetical protein